MSVSIVYSRENEAITAHSVQVEVHMQRGMPSLNIVGLPEKAVKESKDRVRAAIFNSGIVIPVKKITINLAPAEIGRAHV